ncbi:MAG: hypothetical protein IH585_05470 [Anaerolineaceae bacterium]|nr:hypothetical protein [Anaerolineaceae bacterium]
MFYTFKDNIRRLKFDFQCRKALTLPHIHTYDDSNVIALSLLQHKDFIMYLLALKSFTSKVRIKGVVIVDDGSLTKNDISILNNFIPKVCILKKEEFASTKTPVGGCWERLLAITYFCKNNYVVQLDGDTLTLGSIDEITKCVSGDVGFVLGTRDNQDFETMANRVKLAEAYSNYTHVQNLTEINLLKLSSSHGLFYVRGCAGFSGFPINSFTREYVEEMCGEFYSFLGDKWNEWGSEQIMSNVIVANMEKRMVLPHPKYCSVDKAINDSVFLHFIGTHRFKDGVYANLAKKQISEYQ